MRQEQASSNRPQKGTDLLRDLKESNSGIRETASGIKKQQLIEQVNRQQRISFKQHLDSHQTDDHSLRLDRYRLSLPLLFQCRLSFLPTFVDIALN